MNGTQRKTHMLQIVAPSPATPDEADQIVEAMLDFCELVGVIDEVDEEQLDLLDDVEECAGCDSLDDCMLSFTPAQQAQVDAFIATKAIAAAHKVIDTAEPKPLPGDLGMRIQALVEALRAQTVRADGWKTAAERAQKAYAEARERLSWVTPHSPKYPHQEPDAGTAPPRGYGL